jgi:hypothetical protein
MPRQSSILGFGTVAAQPAGRANRAALTSAPTTGSQDPTSSSGPTRQRSRGDRTGDGLQMIEPGGVGGPAAEDDLVGAEVGEASDPLTDSGGRRAQPATIRSALKGRVAAPFSPGPGVQVRTAASIGDLRRTVDRDGRPCPAGQPEAVDQKSSSIAAARFGSCTIHQ